MSYTNALDELRRTAEILLADAHAAFDSACVDGGAPARRNFMRALFACVEGIVYGMKQIAYEEALLREKDFDPGELLLLQETHYELDDKGQPRQRRTFQKVPPNMRFAFASFGKAYGIDWTLPTQEPGWVSLRNAVDVRNRLMHPKRASHLHVSDEDLKQAGIAFEWFKEQFGHICRAVSESLK